MLERVSKREEMEVMTMASANVRGTDIESFTLSRNPTTTNIYPALY
jgi:hypothetical protein